MFKLLGWCFKAAIFTALVLVASHYVTWEGKSVSDTVRSSLSSADRSGPIRTIKKKSRTLLDDAKEAVGKVGIRKEKSMPKDGKIPAEDREQLQSVIDRADDAG